MIYIRCEIINVDFDLLIFLNDYKYSLEILHTALLNLEKKGLRIKYDYYFEIAESLRHKIIIDFNEEDYKESLSYYQRALDFSLKARDISLKNISQLGIILLRIFKRQACANDLNNVIEICDFCNKKKIAYTKLWWIFRGFTDEKNS